jgi:hypothetical protein
MEPTPLDSIDGYVFAVGRGVLEIHRCATILTAIPALLFGRPVPPQLRIVNGATRRRREVELHTIADVEIQRLRLVPSPPSKRAASRPWAAKLVSVSNRPVGPMFRFHDEGSAQKFAAELRRQLAALRQEPPNTPAG